MSISTALTALADDVDAAKAAITAKGGTAPDGTADMADAIAAIPSGGITPTGKKLITDTSETDVAAFATAQISSNTLLAENIKKNVNILGVVGSFEGGGGGGISRTYLGSFRKDASNSNQSAIAAIDWSDGLIFNALMFCPSNNLTSGKLIPYLSDSTTALTNSGIFFQNGNVGGATYLGTMVGTLAFAIEARASADTRTVVIDYSRWAGGAGSIFLDRAINVYACTIDFGGAEA